MTWDIIARGLFVDNGAAAGIAKFNDQIHGVAKAAPGGTRGLNALEGGLRALAFEAVGVQGPIGRVAEGLLKFGGGSALVLGAAAGIGLIAGAYRLANAEAAKLAETNEKLTKTWGDLMARGHATVALQNELLAAVAEQTKAEKELASLKSVGGRLGITRLLPSTPGEIAQAQANVDAAGRNVTILRNQLNQAHGQLAADAAKGGEKWATAFVEGISHLDPQSRIKTLLLARGQFEQIGGDAGDKWATAYLKAVNDRMAGWSPTPRLMQPGLRGPFDIQGFDFTGPGAAFRAAAGPTRSLTVPTFGAGFALAPKEPFTFDAIDRHISRFGTPEPPKREKPDYAAIAASSVALLGAIRQGGAAGILGGAGSVAMSLGKNFTPIGIGLNIASGVFGLFDHSEERRHREVMKQLEELTRIRQNTDKRGQPQRTSVTILVNGKEISGAILDDVIYGIRRAERRNAVPVLPPS
jgi:hypothetical protein